MSFHKKTIRDINLKGKRILLRVDYNVSLDAEGRITSDFRIQKSLPTIKYLLEQKASIILCSHLGRPKGKVDKKYSLKPCAAHLSKLLDKPVAFVSDCLGLEVEKAIQDLGPGDLMMLENVRFHPQEEANDTEFSKKLASYADVFVQDAFGVVHHPASSVTEIPKYLPAVAGLLLENEVNTITEVMEKPKRPLMAIIGGAKISDKLDVLSRFIDIADFVAVGGAMANTLLMSEGIKVGKSLVEPDAKALAKQILNRARDKAQKEPFTFYLPQDGVVATSIEKTAHTRIVDWDAHVTAQIESYPKQPPSNTERVQDNEMVLDIGPFSGAFIAGAMQQASTVVWNGTMGVTEVDALNGPIGPFAHGTDTIVDSLMGEYGHKPFSILGGGDTVAYIEERKLVDYFNHVSTGGGASMELMSGKKLPGVEALQGLDK